LRSERGRNCCGPKLTWIDVKMIKSKFTPYLYAGLFLFIILIILAENSYLLINQTSTNIIETSWLDAEKLINSIVASAKQSIESVQLTDQQIQRHIKKIASRIDRLYNESGEKAEEELKEILRIFKLIALSVHAKDGSLLYTLSVETLPPGIHQSDLQRVTHSEGLTAPDKLSSSINRNVNQWETKLSKRSSDLQMLSIPRSEKPGSIHIFFGHEKKQEIKARIGLQLLINSLENQNVIQYISFVNDQLLIIADYEPSRIDTRGERLEYLESLKTGVSFSDRNEEEETQEFVHPIHLTPDTRGVFSIAFRMAGLQQIYSNTSKITIINSIIIMLIATISALIMLIFHKRNINKMDVMENQIRENEKLLSLANLAAGVAHEVRNPLNSISITIQRLQMEFTPKDEQDQSEYMTLTATMKNEVDRINAIISDFLDFAKPFTPKNRFFSLDEFVEENINFFSGEARKKNIQIKKHILTSQKQFLGDREKLTQVLLNLFFNALEATSKEGTITIYSDLTKDNNWQLKIQDNGAGIANHNFKRIFDIYFTTKKTGTGLGLYICRKIIQAHNGSIELKPNPTRGMTAIVTLPVKPF